MDTPKKTQITNPLSKFEDSPVFNYINNLSPIKPVKSIHITQTFQSLSFSSLPSIFTSPHVSSHKESRFLRRHNCTDSSKPETLSENGNELSSHEEEVHNKSSALQENFNSGESLEVSNEPSSDVKCVIELPPRLKYYSGSPDNEMMECDWENLVPDASELILNSPIEPQSFKRLMEKPVDPCAYFSASVNETHEMQVHAISSSEQLEVEDLSTQHGETIEPEEINQTNLVVNEALSHMQLQAVSSLHRGMRRRCLDFGTVGARGQNLGDASTSSTSTCMERQSNEKFASKDKQLVPVSRCVLPGIGLHLNALARTSTDSMNVELNSFSYGRNSSFVASFRSLTNGEELDESLTLAPETDLDPTDSSVPLVDDVSQPSACLVSEENDRNSPKKKRQKLEGEGEACKHCNCKKSKCLKLYCECFAAGVYCVEPCLCQDCFNKPIHEDTVLATRKQIESRNPLAFAPKVIRNSESVTEIGDEPTKTPASARHKRGCNCKKSSCLKKYCECYQEGVGCSINCRCEGCKNAFGRKDGSAAETVPEEETEGDENNGEIKPTTEIRNYEEQNPSSALPETPLPLCRPKLQLLLSSKSKLSRCCLGGRRSSGFYNGQKYPKHNIQRPQQKFEQQSQMVPNDDVPEMLRGNCTPSTGTKTSPNGKRVSPPHGTSGSSPGFRSGRKLILQSIPSFPSLTTQH